MKVLLNSSILLPSLVTIFMTIPLKYLCFFFFSPFSEFLSCLFIWKVLISSSFGLIFCVYFYVLGTSVISPSFERMTLCRKCYVEPSEQFLWSPELGVLGVSPIWVLCTHILWLGLFVAGALLGMVCSQASWLRKLLVTVAGVLMCEACPQYIWL